VLYPANLIPLYGENFPRRDAYKSTVTQPGRCPANRRWCCCTLARCSETLPSSSWLGWRVHR